MKAQTPEEIYAVITDSAIAATPVVLLYRSKDDAKARSVRIDKVATNEKGEWYFSGEDSLSGQYRSFQFAAVLQAHPLSFGPLVNVRVDMSEQHPGFVQPTMPRESDAYQFRDLEDRFGGH